MKEKLYTTITRKTNILSTKFTDGMVVEESDLTTAQNYPVDLFSTLFQAYFGCGIVCGFDVTFHPEPTKPTDKTHCIKIHSGTAVDCHGYPFRLCEDVIMKFEPEPCPTSTDSVIIYVAARRKQEGEQGREVSDDKCGSGKSKCAHSRLRDMVVIKSFSEDKLPKNLCRITPDYPAKPNGNDNDNDNENEKENAECECRKDCPCDCCGKSWVLLAQIEYIETECKIKCIDKRLRRYIKPIHCHCAAETNVCVPDNTANMTLEARIEHSSKSLIQMRDDLERQHERFGRWSENLQELRDLYLKREQQVVEAKLTPVLAVAEEKEDPIKGPAPRKRTTKKKTPKKRGGK